MKKPTSVVVSHIVTKERTLKKGYVIFVVDAYYYYGRQAVVKKAEVSKVDPEEDFFIAIICDSNGDRYESLRKYNLNDYGRIFFDTEAEAIEAAEKLPKPDQIVYIRINGRYYKRNITRLITRNYKLVSDIYIELYNYSRYISIQEIGTKLWLEHPKKSKKKEC